MVSFVSSLSYSLIAASYVCNGNYINITDTQCSIQYYKTFPDGNPYNEVRVDHMGTCESGFANYKITPLIKRFYVKTFTDIEYIPSVPGCVCPAPDRNKCAYEIQIGDDIKGEMYQKLSCVPKS